PDARPARIELPSEAEDQRDPLARIASALPVAGVVQELAWSGHADDHGAEAAAEGQAALSPAGAPPVSVPLIEDSRLRTMIDELYDELGAASFTTTWQHDPRGLLGPATAFRADLGLLRRVADGVRLLPAGARYRNIKLALPVRHSGEGQLALTFGRADVEGSSA